MERNKKGNIRQTIWLPEAVLELAKKMADKERQTLSKFVELAIIDRMNVIRQIQNARKQIEKKRKEESK